MAGIVRIKWVLSDGSTATGFENCPSNSPPNFQFTTKDINLGVVSAAESSRTFILRGTPYKVDSTLGIISPSNNIENLKIFLAPMPATEETVTLAAAEGFFCDGQASTTVPGYQGTRNATDDINYLLILGDTSFGIQYSLDRGRSFTSFSTSNGNPNDSNTFILLPTSCMSIGRVDGVLQPNDTVEIHIKILMPQTINNTEIGLRQFTLGNNFVFTQ